jgi:hypothetical protein
LFNLANKRRQVWNLKTQTGCGDAVLFDDRGNVLVMGVRASQLRQVRMGPRVVPPQLHIAQPQFVPVAFDPLLARIYNFQDTQNKTAFEMDFSFQQRSPDQYARRQAATS